MADEFKKLTRTTPCCPVHGVHCDIGREYLRTKAQRRRIARLRLKSQLRRGVGT